MREVHFCHTCDFRLPYCVRSDRKFCSGRCRIWAFRHPGQKRVAGTCSEHSAPPQQDAGQPHTKAGALVELAFAQEHIAKLEAEVRAQKEEARRLTEQLKAKRQEADKQAKQAAAKQEAPESAARAWQAETIKKLRRELAEQARAHAVALAAAKKAESPSSKQDKELRALRTRLQRSERAHAEVAAVAAELKRSLRTEGNRRAELEQQLERALSATAPRRILNEQPIWDAESAWQAQHRATELATELAHLRRHRDEVITERERLSARILRLMMPGQYLSHAAGAGYDPTTDPLIGQKRCEPPVLDRYAEWQSVYMKRVTARVLDEEKTLDEQSIEAALAARWRLVNHPPKRLRGKPVWLIIGFVLDEKCERLLLTLSQERVAEMQRRMG